jgi:hypothetical protein
VPGRPREPSFQPPVSRDPRAGELARAGPGGDGREDRVGVATGWCTEAVSLSGGGCRHHERSSPARSAR